VLSRVVFVCVFLPVLSTVAFAQNINDFIRGFGGIIQQGMIVAAQTEWRKLPPPELACIDQTLRQQGNSVDNLANHGIQPSDPHLAEMRSSCHRIANTFGGQNSPIPQLSYGQNLSAKPTFDCVKAKSATARILCLDQDGANADWSLSSTYWALYFYLAENERAAFDKSQQQWLESLTRVCNLNNQQTSFSPPQRQCVLNAFRDRIAEYRTQLRDVASLESQLSPERHAAIQQALISLQLLSDQADGEFGPNTRAAIRQYLARSGLPESDFLTEPQERKLLLDAGQNSQAGTSAALQSDNPSSTSSALFARLIQLPSSCAAIRDPASHTPEVCAAKVDCVFKLLPQMREIADYFRTRPLLLGELKQQPNASVAVNAFNQALGRTQPFLNRPGIDCLRSDWVIGAKSQVEPFVTLAGSLLAKLQSDYEADSARYSDWLAFAKYYDRQAEVIQLKREYDVAYSTDPEQFLGIRPQFLSLLSDAEQIKAKLTSQTNDLTGLEGRLSTISQQLSSASMSGMVSPAMSSSLTALISEVRNLKDTSAADRGDVNAQIHALIDRMKPFGSELDQEIKRESLLNQADDLLNDLNSSEIKAWFLIDEQTALDQLASTRNYLFQLKSVMLDDRDDYSAKLSAAGAAISSAQNLRYEMDDARQLRDTLKAISAKVDARGRDLLDTESSAEITELDELFKTFSTSGGIGPRRVSAEDVRRALIKAQALLNEIDPILQHNAEIRTLIQKGQEYAGKRETTWDLETKKNEMTDNVDQSVRSVQRNENGVVADVKGFCDSGQVEFSALIVDKEGKPTIELPIVSGAFATSGLLRVNDEQPTQKVFRPEGNFRNELSIVRLSKSKDSTKESALLFVSSFNAGAAPVWRIYAQFETSSGSMLIKIPIYDGQIQRMVRSCVLH